MSWLLPRLIGAGRSHELLLTGRLAKEVAWSQLEVGSLQAGIDLENRTQIMTTFTRDHHEQVTAFLENRAASPRQDRLVLRHDDRFRQTITVG